MTDYQILHVLGTLPTPAAQERARKRRDARKPINPDPRQDFADMLTASGKWTREAALAEYDRQFGGRG